MKKKKTLVAASKLNRSLWKSRSSPSFSASTYNSAITKQLILLHRKKRSQRFTLN